MPDFFVDVFSVPVQVKDIFRLYLFNYAFPEEFPEACRMNIWYSDVFIEMEKVYSVPVKVFFQKDLKKRKLI